MLIDGKWTEDWQPVQATDAKGGFVRQVSSFRHWITQDGAPGPTGSGGFAAEPGRYHLFVNAICPWAGRTLIGRALKKLDGLISVTWLSSVMTPQGWAFDAASPDDIRGAAIFLHEIYTRTDPHFTGRATVPVLWDRKTATIVNNESSDILRMFNSAFAAIAPACIDLYPHDLRDQIDALNAKIYPTLNNGVYRAGFATTQIAYEDAFAEVFAMLDELEASIDDPFIFGARLTETDVRLFTTLIRFDIAYYGQFKCNLRRIRDYPRLSAWLERMLLLPDVSACVDFDAIKRGYYSIATLNPTGIVPLGPDLPYAPVRLAAE